MTLYCNARLIVYDDQLKLQTDILESYEARDSREFTLKLRAGHKWSDGHPFTTEDFRYFWEDIANNKELSPSGPSVELLVDGKPPKVEIPDERTIKFSWDGPNPHFIESQARANPLWRAFEQPGEVLAIFHGPQAYVTPAWYPAKQQTGRVVPTWNYAVVHAHGTLRVIDGDARWLRGQLDDLTAQQEAARPHPWKVGDAPADYLASMMSAIVGFEIVISRLTGKFKLSQNHPEVNRQAVREGLADGDARSQDLAAFMQAHGKPRS